MARLGAKVTGIDASEKNIQIAKSHSKKSGLQINYLNSSPENLKDYEKFRRCKKEVIKIQIESKAKLDKDIHEKKKN